MPHEFRGHGFTDAKLKTLPVERMRNLALFNTAVTDNGFGELRRAQLLAEIDISSDILSDAVFQVLSQLPALRSIFIRRGPRIEDRGLRHLTDCIELRELYLQETSITDKGLKTVSKLPQVWSLLLDDTKVSDEGCAALAEMPELELLSLNRTRVTGHGLAALRDTSWDIYLEGAPVTDEGVVAFSERMTNLKVISLSETGVGDAAALALARLPRLDDVRLSHTKITDEGVAAFSRHPTLAVIYLEGCSVSKGAASALKKARRRLTIYGP